MKRSRSLNNYLWLRRQLIAWRERRLRRRGVQLGFHSAISLSAVLEPGQPGGIAIGSLTTVGPLAVIDARRPDGTVAPVFIGSNCFIGGSAVIAPGVTIGHGTVVAGGAVVLRSMPGDCVVAGNPARVVRRGIAAGPYGRMASAVDERLTQAEALVLA